MRLRLQGAGVPSGWFPVGIPATPLAGSEGVAGPLPIVHQVVRAGDSCHGLVAVWVASCLNALCRPSEQAIFQRYMAPTRHLAARTGAVTVIVSQRFSTVTDADFILVLG
ncbi:MAG: ATP-binding cassette, subfamily bacterial, partial [Streptomycetaceae bacterium]|nr:ATP-binding cassette, subfamily bacterial [Streptomycetaceae bacterium]